MTSPLTASPSKVTKHDDPKALLEIAEKKLNKLNTSYSSLLKSPIKIQTNEYEGLIQKFDHNLKAERERVDAELLKLTSNFTKWVHEARIKAYKVLDEQKQIFEDNITFLKGSVVSFEKITSPVPELTHDDLKSSIEKTANEKEQSALLQERVGDLHKGQKYIEAQTREKAFQNKLVEKVKAAPDTLVRKNATSLKKFLEEVEQSIQTAIKNYQPKGIRPFKQKAKPSTDLEVQARNYFNPGVTPVMHYFVPDSKQLKVVTLPENPEIDPLQVEVTELDNDFNVPAYHGSLVLPDGKILLIGGIAEGRNASAKTYEYDPNTKSLHRRANLNVGRYGFGITSSKGRIFVAGGITASGVTATAEAYDVATDKWTMIAEPKSATAHSALANFNNSHIYKFSGYNPDQTINYTIERYSIKENVWTSLVSEKAGTLPLYPLGNCMQVNSTQILFFGGLGPDKKCVKSSFVLNVETTVETGETSHFISDLNGANLLHAEGFWNPQSVAHMHRVFTLQNSSDETGQVYGRRCIMFEKRAWKVLSQ